MSNRIRVVSAALAVTLATTVLPAVAPAATTSKAAARMQTTQARLGGRAWWRPGIRVKVQA
jgi:hypothetical protein